MLPPHIFPVLVSLMAAFLPLYSAQLSQVVGDHGEVGVAGGAAADQQPRIYIVHVQPPERMVWAGPEEVEEWHKSFLPSPTLDSGEPRLVFSYKTVLSGFAARLTAGEVRAMEAKEGFLRALPDQELIHLTTHSPDFLGLRPTVWQLAHGTGKGAIIGLIDTGITHTHDSFRGNTLDNATTIPGWNRSCYFDKQLRACNDKLLGGVRYNEINQREEPPYEDPFGRGHGTHVAGIAAGLEISNANVRNLANGTAAGAAPGAYLAMYRADTDALMLWCIEQAISDGVHIISISLRRSVFQPRPFHMDHVAIGALSAVRHGVPVIAAAGNDGPSPATVSNDAPWIMTVGASTLGRVLLLNLQLDDGSDPIPGESLYTGPPVGGELVFPGSNGRKESKHCEDVSHVDVRDKVVMCLRGSHKPRWSALDMANVVKQNGGRAMIYMNKEEIGSIITEIPDVDVPTVAVNWDGTRRLIDVFMSSAGPGTVQLIPRGTMLGVPPFPAVPYFSSRGPSKVNGGILKPDILGPGVNILSARAWSDKNFSLKSGTSMATPHVSGVAAILKLYLQRRHNKTQWTPAMIRSAIMTTSETTNRQRGPITDEKKQAAGLFATGAGHVNAAGAMNPGLVYNIEFDDYVRYLCGRGYTPGQIWEIAKVVENCSAPDRTLDTEQLNYPSISVSLSLSSPGASKKTWRTVTSLHPHNYTVAHRLLPTQQDVTVIVDPKTLNFTAVGESQTFAVQFYLARFPGAKTGDVLQGHLTWASPAHTVTSPLLVTFVR